MTIIILTGRKFGGRNLCEKSIAIEYQVLISYKLLPYFTKSLDNKDKSNAIYNNCLSHRNIDSFSRRVKVKIATIIPVLSDPRGKSPGLTNLVLIL